MLGSLSKQNIFFFCVAISLCAHVVSLVLLEQYSFWYAIGSPRAASFDVSQVEKVDKGQILKEAFVSSSPQHPEKGGMKKTIARAQAGLELLRAAQERERFWKEPILAAQKHPTPALPDVPSFSLELSQMAWKPPSFSLPSIQGLHLLEQIPKEAVAPVSLPPPLQERSLCNLKPDHQGESAPSYLEKIRLKQKESDGLAAPALSALLPPKESSFALIHSAAQSAPYDQKSASKLKMQSRFSHVPTLEDLGTASYSDLFDAEVVFSELDGEEGYFFAITLVPRADLDLPKIRQHYSFLIDRSNSIQRERLSTTKNAVLKAIKDLNLEDSFNVITFDNKIDKLYSAPMPATPAAIGKAKEFLGQIQLGSFFSPANLYKPLVLTLPSSDEDIYTTILLTDGDPLQKKQAQREFALGWTSLNQGKASLFTIGLASDGQLETLEAVSALNRGGLSYSPTQRGIRRKLLKLMKSISYPIAKNLSARVISLSKEDSVRGDFKAGSCIKTALYPLPHQTPHLYQKEPYTIFGKTKTLDPFVLFVQGKAKNQWIHIKKPIFFTNAKKAFDSLKAQWALQRAHQIYEQYLYDQNPEHLLRAAFLLEPHNLRVAFQ